MHRNYSGCALARSLLSKSSSTSYRVRLLYPLASAGPMLAWIPRSTRSMARCPGEIRRRSDLSREAFDFRTPIIAARQGLLGPSPQHWRFGGLVSVAALRHAEMETKTPLFERGGGTMDYKSAQRPPLGDIGNIEEKRLRCEAGKEQRVLKQSACTRNDGATQSADEVELLNEARDFLKQLMQAPFARALPRTTDPFSWPLCQIAEPEDVDNDQEEEVMLSDSPLKPGYLLIWNRVDEKYPMNERQ